MSDLIQDYQRIQDHIEMGHTYASITLALPYAKDAIQLADMEATLKALYKKSGYIRDVLDKHPDPISALASRGSQSDSGSEGDYRGSRKSGVGGDDRGCGSHTQKRPSEGTLRPQAEVIHIITAEVGTGTGSEGLANVG